MQSSNHAKPCAVILLRYVDARRGEIPAELAPASIVTLGSAHEAPNLNANLTDGLAPCRHDAIAFPVLPYPVYTA